MNFLRSNTGATLIVAMVVVVFFWAMTHKDHPTPEEQYKDEATHALKKADWRPQPRSLALLPDNTVAASATYDRCTVTLVYYPADGERLAFFRIRDITLADGTITRLPAFNTDIRDKLSKDNLPRAQFSSVVRENRQHIRC